MAASRCSSGVLELILQEEKQEEGILSVLLKIMATKHTNILALSKK